MPSKNKTLREAADILGLPVTGSLFPVQVFPVLPRTSPYTLSQMLCLHGPWQECGMSGSIALRLARPEPEPEGHGSIKNSDMPLAPCPWLAK